MKRWKWMCRVYVKGRNRYFSDEVTGRVIILKNGEPAGIDWLNGEKSPSIGGDIRWYYGWKRGLNDLVTEEQRAIRSGWRWCWVR